LPGWIALGIESPGTSRDEIPRNEHETMTAMRRGELWRVRWDDEFREVVVLSNDDASSVKAIQIVAPAEVDIAGIAVEVHLGAAEGLDWAGVVRAALPRPGRTLCAWIVTLPGADFVERRGTLDASKLAELDEMLRRAELE
jgi:mRNA interferase MazF